MKAFKMIAGVAVGIAAIGTMFGGGNAGDQIVRNYNRGDYGKPGTKRAQQRAQREAERRGYTLDFGSNR